MNSKVCYGNTTSRITTWPNNQRGTIPLWSFLQKDSRAEVKGGKDNDNDDDEEEEEEESMERDGEEEEETREEDGVRSTKKDNKDANATKDGKNSEVRERG